MTTGGMTKGDMTKGDMTKGQEVASPKADGKGVGLPT